jgi:hypothetical protein
MGFRSIINDIVKGRLYRDITDIAIDLFRCKGVSCKVQSKLHLVCNIDNQSIVFDNMVSYSPEWWILRLYLDSARLKHISFVGSQCLGGNLCQSGKFADLVSYDGKRLKYNSLVLVSVYRSGSYEKSEIVCDYLVLGIGDVFEGVLTVNYSHHENFVLISKGGKVMYFDVTDISSSGGIVTESLIRQKRKEKLYKCIQEKFGLVSVKNLKKALVIRKKQLMKYQDRILLSGSVQLKNIKEAGWEYAKSVQPCQPDLSNSKSIVVKVKDVYGFTILDSGNKKIKLEPWMVKWYLGVDIEVKKSMIVTMPDKMFEAFSYCPKKLGTKLKDIGYFKWAVLELSQMLKKGGGM